MIIEYIAPDYHHVSLADLLRLSDNGLERSFATSEQLIEWVKNHPDQEFRAVRRGAVGEKLAPSPLDTYSLRNGDIICGGRGIVYATTLGLKNVGLGVGSG